MYYQTFEVTGSGGFPFDMLRYDSCFPYSQADVSKITSVKTQRTVKLARRYSNKNEQVTRDRWRSFNWHVTCIGNAERA